MSEDDLQRRFDALTAAAGLSIPAERRPAMLDGYRTVLLWAEMVRAAAPPAATGEPANAFDPATIERLSRPTRSTS